MAKKKKYNLDDDEASGEPAQDPVKKEEETEQQQPRRRQKFQGSTGYNYGEDYTYRSGRPPSKTDWDAMSQEQRDQIGLPDFASWKNAAREWRSGFAEGGGNRLAQQSLADALYSGGARSFDDVLRIAGSQGYEMAPDMGQALLKRLRMAYEGTADPSGRYHRDPASGQWVDVGTSDLAKRGIPGAADYMGAPLSGIEAVLAALGGSPDKSEREYFQRGVAQGDWTEWPPGSGKYFNDPGNDPSRRVWQDGRGQPTTAPADGGPQFDYSQIDQTKTRIADYLAGPYQQQQQYQQGAANATPYTPGTGNNASPPAAASSSFMSPGTTATRPAWGASPTPQQKSAPAQPIRTPQPARSYDYTPQTRTNAFTSPQQQRKPRNLWGL